MGEIMKKRTYYDTDENYRITIAYAKSKGRPVSEFIRYAIQSEMSKHVKNKSVKAVVTEIIENILKEEFRDMVEQILAEMLEKRFPARGRASEGGN